MKVDTRILQLALMTCSKSPIKITIQCPEHVLSVANLILFAKDKRKH